MWPKFIPNYQTVQTLDEPDENRILALYTVTRYPNGTKIIKYCIRVLIALLCLSQVAILVLQIKYTLADNKQRHKGIPEDWSLYKNTQFANCARNVSTITDCHTLLTTEPEKFGVRYITRQAYEAEFPQDVGNAWCDLVACLHDFKIVPSSPTRSAFRKIPLEFWYGANMMLIVILFMMETLFFEEHRLHECEGITAWDWAAKAWSLLSFLLWCYGVLNLLLFPIQSTVGSPASWITTWYNATSFHHHPISCRLHHRKTLRRFSMILLYLLAVLQYGTSYWVFTVDYVNHFPRYKCLQEDVAHAPGFSNCTSEQICQKDSLFYDPRFNTQKFPQGAEEALIIISIIYGAIAALPLVISALVESFSWCFRIQKNDFCKRYFSINPCKSRLGKGSLLATLVLFLFLSALANLRFWIVIIALWEQEPFGSTLAIDTACHAVHVSLSPQRGYYISDKWWATIQVARSWFNA